MFPCCPVPNPFREVQQGAYIYPLYADVVTYVCLFLSSRFGRPRFALRAILQVGRPRACPGQHLHRVSARRRCENPNHPDWPSKCHVCATSFSARIHRLTACPSRTRDNVNVEMYVFSSLPQIPPKFICIVIIQRLRRLLPNQQPLPLRLRHQRPPQSPH
jgi:hypothetical protein